MATQIGNERPMPARTVKVSRKKKFGLRKVSAKRAILNKVYLRLRNQFLVDQRICGIAGCLNHTSDVHHTKKRGRYLLDVSTWRAVCRKCHNWIHDNPAKARELGLLA